MTASIAVIGVGRMGLAICGRLLDAGVSVLASDIDPGRQREARRAGARVATSATEAAAGAEVVLTVLPGSRELVAVAAEIVPQMSRATTWIDMTSASPAVGRGWAAEAVARGAECLEAPMGGGVSAARAGTLQLFVGGPAATLDRQRTLLHRLGTIEHMGDRGAGYTTKLLVNLLWFGQAAAGAEALLLARRAGIDLETLADTLTRTAAASEFIRRDLPSLLAGDYLASFGLDRCRDQLAVLCAMADEQGVPFALSDAVLDLFEAALERYGAVDGELLPVALLEEQAGVRLSAPPHPGA